MATGTGKTWVMAMIILWLSLNEKSRTDILIMVPNLTVKDRLSVLEHSDSKIYKNLLPPNMKMPGNLHITILNFQAFQPKTELAINGDSDTPSRTIKDLLKRYGETDPEEWTETEEKMLNRRLASHRGAQKIIVLNDEAHHCYRPADVKENNEDGAEKEQAALWFNALRALQKQRRLGWVFDLSATPMYLKKPDELKSELFPWTVSDYALIDAIEAGLTKIPRVPVEDDVKDEKSGMPIYRNIFDYLPKSKRKIKHDKMPQDVYELLDLMYKHYNEINAHYKKSEIVPVMIVVANTVANANELYKYIAGYCDMSKESNAKKMWRKGMLEAFSNVESDGSGPVRHLPTLLVHSKIDETGMEEESGIVNIQKDFFDDEMSKKDLGEHIRCAFNTIGSKGEPGEHVRCIISVSMLTEGWDARTVTHIFGFRPFKSQLLCEQVAGRALRRTTLPYDKTIETSPEYAYIFGVPFSFMRGKNGPPPSPPRQLWKIRTVEDRKEYRITFPNISSYVVESPSIYYQLDPAKVRKYRPINKTPKKVVIGDITGKTQTILVKNLRDGEVIYGLADRVTKLFYEKANTNFVRNAVLFSSTIQAAREWLKHPNVSCDIKLLADEENLEAAAIKIVEACIEGRSEKAIRPIFADEMDSSQPHSHDTSNIEFETSLKWRYPKSAGKITGHSELNAAACHSEPEQMLADILDAHERVQAWARNFRLGWNIPYFDHSKVQWRSYTPDFVARIAGSELRHLVIEFKGQSSEDSKSKAEYTKQWWQPAVNASNDRACAGLWKYLLLENTHGTDEAREAIDSAIESPWGVAK